MSKIFYTSKIIFKEIVREKFYYLLLLSGGFFLLFTIILNEMVVGQPAKVTKDLSLASLSIFPFIFLLVYGTRIISKEIESKSIYTIIIRPFKRWEYILSNYLALIFSVIILNVFLMILSFITIKIFYGEIWLVPLLKCFYFSFLEAIVLVVFVLLFSSVFSSTLSLILFLLIYVTGHAIEESLKSIAQGSGIILKPVINVIKFIIPNLSFFDYKTELLYSIDISKSIYFLSPLYSLTYTIIIFLITLYFFQKKEL